MIARFSKLGIFILMISCQVDQGDRQAMIQELVDKKLKDFTKNKNKSCYEEIEKLATIEVDSILIEKARLAKEQLVKPVIPEKPKVPELKTPFDDSPVEPIIKQ